MQIIVIKNTIFYKNFCSIRISTPQAFFHNRNALRIINASASVNVANSIFMADDLSFLFLLYF